MSFSHKELEQKKQEMFQRNQEETKQKQEFESSLYVNKQEMISKEGTESPIQIHNKQHFTQFLSKYKEKFFRSSIKNAAEGEPEQHYHAPKRSYKQKKEDEMHIEIAKEKSGWDGADLFTYETVTALRDYNQLKGPTAKMINDPATLAALNAHHADLRMIKAFCNGYRTKPGTDDEPLNEEEEAKKQLDQELISSYATGKLEDRIPFLDNATDYILNTEVQPWMFKEEDYVRDHAVELKIICDRFVYFENLLKDPINKPYFDEMEPMKLEVLKAQFSTYSAMSTLLVTMMGSHGVKLDHLDYDYSIKEAGNAQYTALIEPVKGLLDTAMKERDTQKREILEKYQGGLLRQTIRSSVNPNPDLSGQAGGAAEIEAFKKSYGDGTSEGYAKLANEAYQQTLAEGKSESEALVASKTAIGFRLSSNTSAQTFKAMRGSLFDTFRTDYISMYDKMAESYSMADLNALRVVRTIPQVGGAYLKLGGGVETAAREILAMFRKRMESDEGKRLTKTLKDEWGNSLDMFKEKPDRCVAYILDNLMLTTVSESSAIISRHSEDMELRSYATEVSKLLMKLPRMEEKMTDEDMAALGEDYAEVGQLFKEYKSLLSFMQNPGGTSSDSTSPDDAQ